MDTRACFGHGRSAAGFLLRGLLLAALWGGLGSQYVAAQDQELGLPFLQNYTPREYEAKGRNTAIAQDKRGVMYFANQQGVLVYDGVRWELIRLPGRVAVRSLTADSEGRIWVGAEGTFGYLRPSRRGQTEFIPILNQVAPEEQSFGFIWRVHALHKRICFQAFERMFCWTGEKVQVFVPSGEGEDAAFDFSFLVRGKLYVQHRTRGLLVLEGDSLVAAPGGDAFANRLLFLMLPYDEERILVGDEWGQLYLYDGQSTQPFPTTAETFLRENQINGGTVLSDGTFAIATVRGGVAIIERSGVLQRVIDVNTDLQDEEVLAVATDREGGLWLALDGGLARVEIPSPLNVYDDRVQLDGRVLDIARHPGNGRLYVATTLGAYFLQPSSDLRFADFEPLFGITTRRTYQLVPAGSELYIVAEDGIYAVVGVDAVRKVWEGNAQGLHVAKARAGTFFISSGDSLLQVRANGNWQTDAVLPLKDGLITSLSEGEEGVLWAGTQRGVARIDYQKAFRATVYGAEEELPAGSVRVQAFGEEVVFLTQDGAYQFDAGRNLFESHERLQPGRGVRQIRAIGKDKQGQAWVVPADSLPLLGIPEGEGYRWQPTLINRVGRFDIHTLYLDNGKVWIGGADGIVRYDTRRPEALNQLFNTVIRRVTTAEGDSLLYGGSHAPDAEETRLPSTLNQVQFEFAAPAFEGRGTRYQYWLEGEDRGWSDLTERTTKDYTSLSPGHYVFHVRAQNAYGQLSEEDTFTFHIVPPWYRRWWMYPIYLLLFLAAMVGLVQWRSERLLRQNRELEQAVQERTAALRESRDELAEKNETLQSTLKELRSTQQQLVQSEKMAALGTLTAGVAHEIKNPLNFVNNFAELSVELAEELKEELEAQREKIDEESYEEVVALLADLNANASKISEHGKRADSIVRNMLMHSRGKAGQREDIELNAFLKEYVNLAFHGERARNPSFNIKIEEDYDPALEKTSLVPQDMSRVFLNLLSNAFYATHQKQKEEIEGYTPTVRISTKDKGRRVEMRFRDNGVGMPADVRAKIFEPFFTTKPSGEGTGLGLSLSYDIVVNEHKGQMEVRSEEGEFTEFVLTIPKK